MVVGQPGKLVPVLRVVGSSPILVAKTKSLDLCDKRHKSRLFSCFLLQFSNIYAPKKEAILPYFRINLVMNWSWILLHYFYI